MGENWFALLEHRVTLAGTAGSGPTRVLMDPERDWAMIGVPKSDFRASWSRN